MKFTKTEIITLIVGLIMAGLIFAILIANPTPTGASVVEWQKPCYGLVAIDGNVVACKDGLSVDWQKTCSGKIVKAVQPDHIRVTCKVEGNAGSGNAGATPTACDPINDKYCEQPTPEGGYGDWEWIDPVPYPMPGVLPYP